MHITAKPNAFLRALMLGESSRRSGKVEEPLRTNRILPWWITQTQAHQDHPAGWFDWTSGNAQSREHILQAIDFLCWLCSSEFSNSANSWKDFSLINSVTCSVGSKIGQTMTDKMKAFWLLTLMSVSIQCLMPIRATASHLIPGTMWCFFFSLCMATINQRRSEQTEMTIQRTSAFETHLHGNACYPW